MVNNYKYDEWGNITTSNETVSNPFKYAGEVYDQETGLYYLRARYYDPTIGRFINEDSYEGQVNNPLTLNLYSYCENNPLYYIDPSGNSSIPLWIIPVEAEPSPIGDIIVIGYFIYKGIQVISDANADKNLINSKEKDKNKDKNKVKSNPNNKKNDNNKDSKGHLVPKTGKWHELGETKNEFIKRNNFKTVRTSKGNTNGTGPQTYEVYDSNGKNIGRIDTGYKINGKQTPDHFHLYDDPAGNVHYWFD